MSKAERKRAQIEFDNYMAAQAVCYPTRDFGLLKILHQAVGFWLF